MPEHTLLIKAHYTCSGILKVLPVYSKMLAEHNITPKIILVYLAQAQSEWLARLPVRQLHHIYAHKYHHKMNSNSG